MKVLLDINTVLDVVLVRQPWFDDASRIWDANRDRRITAALAAFSVPTIFYVVRKQIDLAHAHDAVRVCLTSLEVVPVQRATLEAARALPGTDFEDNLQLACAIESQLDAVVTRDPGGFPGATIPILTPADLVARLAQGTL
jgi:predicted nucleic acid-binding protein